MWGVGCDVMHSDGNMDYGRGAWRCCTVQSCIDGTYHVAQMIPFCRTFVKVSGLLRVCERLYTLALENAFVVLSS